MSDFETRSCESHGEYQSRRVGPGLFEPCGKCMDEREAKMAGEAEAEGIRQRDRSKQAKARAAKGRIIASGIPARFHEVRIDGFVAATKGQIAARDFAASFASGFSAHPGANGLFLGRIGTGKTHLACAIGLELIEGGRSVHYTTVQRAARRVKDAWAQGAAETESAAVAALSRPDLLILDEVGVQHGTDFERNLLFDVMNERYENRRSTLIISNLGKVAVADLLGDRVIDRMREDGCDVIQFDWESYRRR